MPQTSVFPRSPGGERNYRLVLGLSLLFFALTSWTSYVHWSNFAYRTFDLAYYVQALWQLAHGRFEVSVQYVPLLGNHVEPIVFLIAPIFFFVRHPMVFVVVQNAALATMGPVAFRSARRCGLTSGEALVLAVALLVTPATSYVALHEFHPEALSAPFLLLMLNARLAGSVRQYWFWFIATLACKENMALLLAGYCLVQGIVEWKSSKSHLLRWYLLPMVAALIWFVLCARVITPALNSGNIDYGALYDRLGANAGEIVRNAFTKPQLFAGQFWHALLHGNLVSALFLPFLCLPVLRPRWILIATPVFLQHLLSWRASEWNIYFHYAAPLLPLLWIATAEAVSRLGKWRAPVAWLVLLGCLLAQVVLGPAKVMLSSTKDWLTGKDERARKNAVLALVPRDASIVAPLPYLSHLAMREELHSLHYILKGLRTLSRQPFQMPAPTEFVLIDYGDSATFDREAGYYHPTMRTVDGRIIPSSEMLLHDFLKRQIWNSESWNQLTLLQRDRSFTEVATVENAPPVLQIDSQVELISIVKSAEMLTTRDTLEVTSIWQFYPARETFPWLELHLMPEHGPTPIVLTRGLCGVEAGEGADKDKWLIRLDQVPVGAYNVMAVFQDNSRSTLLAQPVSLGRLTVSPSN